MPKVVDMAQSDAMHRWWSEVKRKNPEAVPSPADSFAAGFKAAQAIYQRHAEEAMDELSRLKFPDLTGS